MHCDSSMTGRFGDARASVRICVLLLVVALAGCAQPTLPEPQDGVTEVRAEGIAFVPKEVTIRVGESVRWTNTEPLAILHTTTSGNPGDADAGVLWDSDTLRQGESFTHRFDEVGDFVYFCEFHPTVPAMRDARVIVVAE